MISETFLRRFRQTMENHVNRMAYRILTDGYKSCQLGWHDDPDTLTVLIGELKLTDDDVATLALIPLFPLHLYVDRAVVQVAKLTNNSSVRYGDWSETYSGKKFYQLDPLPEDIDIQDIAHALSRMCRFAGHTREFWSVAQHSLLVSRLAGEMYCPYHNNHRQHSVAYKTICDIELAGLLHDASEAYLVDIPRPIKYTSTMLPYRESEQYLQDMIYGKYCQEYGSWIHHYVKRADNVVLLAEKFALFGEDVEWEGNWWLGLVDAARNISIDTTKSIDEIEHEFMERFNELSLVVKEQNVITN